MKPTAPTQRRQHRKRELAMFMPQKAAQADPDAWVDGLTDAEFARMLGPSWAMMTERQRALYPNLPPAEMDKLWGDSEEVHRDVA